MKKYKLLKDTPTIKAGTVFEEVVGDFDGLKALTRITPVGAKTSPQFTIKDIDNFDEWFEEISEYRGGEQNITKNIGAMMVMVAYTVLLKTDIKLIVIVSSLVTTLRLKKRLKFIRNTLSPAKYS
ncbi:hypothetical protein HG463_001735 [Candidatus Saccharibacteria bacterium]|nr:hypothetical protein [Candidatus Saccharibacteria bacterium]